ncbi:MAG: response regulator [Bacteroidota bacterium]
MKRVPINILLIEDNPGDARLIQEMLLEQQQVKIELHRAATLAAARDHLKENSPDVALLDLSLPDGKGIESSIMLIEQHHTIPFVILTGLDDERVGLDSVQRGAQDYLVKGQIDSKMIVRVLSYAIERKQHEREKVMLIRELQELFSQVKTLRGLLPMCPSCKKIRDDAGQWTILETFIKENSNTEISHGLCPECSENNKD